MEHFATTRWSLVLDASSELTPLGRDALATLCELYWYPLYAYLRRRGHNAADAQDLTQGFFVHLLETGALRIADRTRGRFRSFLLASLNHYCANTRDRDRAQKRGGGAPQISLDRTTAEDRYLCEPADHTTPETVFDRHWALTVLDRVFRRLRADMHAEGRGELFEHLKVYLTGEAGSVLYSTVGLTLGMSEGAVKVAVHRMRRRYRDLLHQEIAQTVVTADDVELELQYLIAALST
jgi:DNA-directed RNA polymerase specialized sigma24 family protein